MKKAILETERLIIRKPKPVEEDINFYLELWNHPDVMRMVGFPQGLGITKEKVEKHLIRDGDKDFDRTLIVQRKKDGKKIGEAKLGLPDEQNIAHTDVKLLPRFWGMGYGKEIKQALVDHIFTSTDALAVEASPNKKNVASQRMQLSVGAVFVKEEVYHFPEKMKSFTEDVHCMIFRLYREEWEKRRQA